MEFIFAKVSKNRDNSKKLRIKAAYFIIDRYTALYCKDLFFLEGN